MMNKIHLKRLFFKPPFNVDLDFTYFFLTAQTGTLNRDLTVLDKEAAVVGTLYKANF